MVTTPTFVVNTDTLRSQLRLSGQPTGGDGEAQFGAALLEVRSGFIRELGATRVIVLQALAFSENPITADQALRAVANLTEVKWMKAVLIRVLPMLFMDASADQTQIYHDEAAFREASALQLDAERIRLENEVAINLQLLAGTETIGSESSVRLDTPVSDDPIPLPGGTIFGGGQLGGHFV